MRGELMWVGWVSGSTLLQGTSVMMSVFIFNGTSGRVEENMFLVLDFSTLLQENKLFSFSLLDLFQSLPAVLLSV
eukprot:1161986-Pelagomonas_calceolata.AAC.7